MIAQLMEGSERMLDPATAIVGHPCHFSGDRSREETRWFAAGLLSQQIWCWGQDIKRTEGNWLLEIGFRRTTPPTQHENCASVYRLELPSGQRIVLRGFGVFFGDDRHGGIFVERFGFSPQLSRCSHLVVDPWSSEDLPPMRRPRDPSETIACRMLLLSLIDWIIDYEFTLRSRLGHAYRINSLQRWNNGKHYCLASEHVMSAWRQLSLLIGSGRFCFGEED
ncbi:MAG: hypothetical protein GY904_22625 [Planctomycetaceae bacterium]|jgi:hypothetical protein|nr:hypothetical protein [Planctomycetaceae bacterium]